MTKAMLMRDTVTRARKAKEEERVKQHIGYVNKLIDTKVYKTARKGLTAIRIKVKRKYSSALTIDAFENKGFEVTKASYNGRAVLTVRW
jgi:hypothetical protein